MAITINIDSQVQTYDTMSLFPATGIVKTIYIAKDTDYSYYWDGGDYVQLSGGASGGTWGTITGTLSDQTDLQTELDNINTELSNKQNTSEKGLANGYASLDSGGKIPATQLPNSVMEFKGAWDASTNTPTLANGTGNAGDVYRCSVAGSVNFGAGNISFGVGDWVMYNGSIWQHSPATDAVTSVNTKTGAVTLNYSDVGALQQPTGTTAQYIDGTGALQTLPTSTSVVQHVVKAGESLTKGQAVYVSSADGTNMIVNKASNTTEGLSSKTMGLITADLALNGQGYVITEGLLSGLNTNSANVGDPVWLGINGNLIYGLANKPYAPAHLVYIGIVTRKSATVGEIFVRVQNGFELKELHDVSAQSPSNQDSLVYNSSTSLWEATTTKIEVLHAWDSVNSYDYMGVAKLGTATSATTWTITRIVVASNGTTTKGTATGAWDNRASLTYV